MGNIIDIAGAIITRSNFRAEISAHNIANVTTPGYKSQRSFETMIDIIPSQDAIPINSRKDWDWSDGKLVSTHNNLDLAIAGNGFFVLRQEDKTFYTRAGHFTRDADGHVVSSGGARLQTIGGDLQIQGSAVTIDADGMLHDDGEDGQQIALVDFADKGALRNAGGDFYTASNGAAQPVASPDIHQGMLEASNVSDMTEMITLMASLRSAETGQKLAQLYDDLMTQAATSFGQGAG